MVQLFSCLKKQFTLESRLGPHVHCIWEGENFWKSRSKRKKLRKNTIRLDLSKGAVACFLFFGYLTVGFPHVVG